MWKQAILLMGLLVWMSACSSKMHIQVIEYPEAPGLAPKEPGCEIVTHPTDASVPAGCVDIGDVFVADTGWSTNCGPERVIAEVKDRACRLGADAIVVREVKDGHSTCHEVRARLLHCSSREATS